MATQTQSKSSFAIQDLREHPEHQLAYLNSSFANSWESPEDIRSAVNRVAEAQGLSERLESTDLLDIVHFARKLGFEATLSKL